MGSNDATGEVIDEPLNQEWLPGGVRGCLGCVAGCGAGASRWVFNE